MQDPESADALHADGNPKAGSISTCCWSMLLTNYSGTYIFPILSELRFTADQDGGHGHAARKEVVNPFAKIQLAAAKRAELAKKGKGKEQTQETCYYSRNIFLYFLMLESFLRRVRF